MSVSLDDLLKIADDETFALLEEEPIDKVYADTDIDAIPVGESV